MTVTTEQNKIPVRMFERLWKNARPLDPPQVAASATLWNTLQNSGRAARDAAPLLACALASKSLTTIADARFSGAAISRGHGQATAISTEYASHRVCVAMCGTRLLIALAEELKRDA